MLVIKFKQTTSHTFFFLMLSLQWQKQTVIEEFEDTKGVIRIRISKKNRQHNAKRKSTKGQTTIYKTLHRKLKIDQHEPNYHSNNHLPNITQKTKDWPTRTQLSLKQPSTKHYTENKRLTMCYSRVHSIFNFFV